MPEARRRASLPVAPALAAAILILGGCAREAPDRREVRLAAQRYLAALADKDVGVLAQRATCVVPTGSVQGGHVLRIEAPRRTNSGALDSLVRFAQEEHRAADSLWSQARDLHADSLHELAMRWRRAHMVYRNAIRAVSLSHPDTVLGGSATLETREIRVRVRFGGPLVGPKPIDREEILRLLRAPGGSWIAFSLFLPEDDPHPDGV